ncbi:MAG: cbb3-type cytochrome oxidase assembly protein CcoS [Burkholderiales bacterium]|uniref:cbb3-type cytochrome oxidase assembly protein CcoS n=1 Tax=Inhella sp. TaxID=1921806 RepID=UPI001ACF77EA|nr:cbb3-type cytochrome oxidase assembly protein CcoS [Burkholderiales bacterium]
MEILYLLVPVSVVLALLVLIVFAWALKGGQFERLDAEGERILFDEDQTGKKTPPESP